MNFGSQCDEKRHHSPLACALLGEIINILRDIRFLLRRGGIIVLFLVSLDVKDNKEQCLSIVQIICIVCISMNWEKNLFQAFATIKICTVKAS